jgi:hypothetical protein
MAIAMAFLVLPIRASERGACYEFAFSQLDRGEAEATETISWYELDVLHGPECVYKPARRNDGIGVWTLIRGQVAERSNRAAVRNYPNLN